LQTTLTAHPEPSSQNGFVSVLREKNMAVNKPVGDKARKGAVRKRTQLETKVMGEKHWTKRSKASGQFLDQKKKGRFKGVRREK
jgi:hypothetical protein